ncbi:major facilitator superfamily domain-containing protein 4A [Lethenteron reissneri]|uniref:major facilitator superfamily domain-containing protein 4A n=1 Tax=Lethenteron reissneri TaxID=7753 RepID=UPI002AB72AEE|nr:major facilitator superfamily domain-containing protein 4A [Lethenteron reissneri]
MARDPEPWVLFTRNLQATLTYCSVFFTFGLCASFLGPTLLDLRCQTHSSLEAITWVFFSQALCTLLGSVLAGMLLKRVSAAPLLFVATLSVSVLFVVVPLCSHVVLLALVLALVGLAMGCIDTIANTQILRLFQHNASPFLQALHFWAGLGGLLSPLIAEPFLSDDHCLLTANATVHNFSKLESLRSELVPHHVAARHDAVVLPLSGRAVTNVQYAFWIMAFINLPVPLAVLFLMVRSRCSQCCSQEKAPLLGEDISMDDDDGDSGPDHDRQGPTQHGILNCFTGQNLSTKMMSIHILGMLILLFSEGVLSEFAGFVHSYSTHSSVRMLPSEAAFLNSLFWGFITLGRLVSIPLSTRVPLSILLSINWMGCVASFAVMLTFSRHPMSLYFGTAAFGLFLSSVFPSGLALTEDSLNYRGCATTLLVTGASAGEMFLPVIVGTIIDQQGYGIFLPAGLIICVLGLLAFLGLIACRRFFSSHDEDRPHDSKVEPGGAGM